MAQIFRPSTKALARASIVDRALNRNTLGVDRYALARSSTPPRTDCFCRLPQGVTWTPMTATKDTLAEEDRQQSIAIHHTYSHGEKAAEHTP